MSLIKIPKYYLVSQDKDSMTVDIPESMLLYWKKDSEKVSQTQGTFKHKKEARLAHLNSLR